VPQQFPVADSQAVVAAVAVVLLNQMVPAVGVGLAEQGTADIEAVEAGVSWDRLPDQSCQAGCQVDGADHFVRHARSNRARPAGDKRRAGAALVDTVLAA
jgi:hypothetical protein